MKKIVGFSFLLMFLLSLKTQAVCPVCTVAVGAGVGFSRWLGIDDVISGLWVGGLTVSLITWTINWLNSKKIYFKGRKILTVLFYYAIIVVPLYWSDIIGHPMNTLWGIDKLLLGIILGSLIFILANLSYEWLKKRNNNHSYFPFQKVAMPLGFLLILSLIFYFLI